MLLADREDDGLADLAAHRVVQRVFEKGPAEQAVRGVGEEAFLERALFVRLLLVLAGGVGERHDEPFLGEELGRHVGARVDDGRVDEKAVAHPVEQRIAEGRLPAFAAEGAIRVEQQAAFGLALRVRGPRPLRRVRLLLLPLLPRGHRPRTTALQIVARRGGQTQLVAHEIVEDRAGVAADGAVRLVGDDQVEVRGREQPLVFVGEQQGLHRGDDDLGAAPVVASFLVHDGREVRAEQGGEDLAGLLLQFQPVHQKQHAPRIARAQEQLDDRGRGERLARAGRHLEQEAVVAVGYRALDRADGLELIRAQKTQFVGLDEAGAFRGVSPRDFGRIAGPLGADDVVVVDRLVDQAPRIGRDRAGGVRGLGRGKRGDEVGVAALQVPEIMQVAVGEQNEAAVQRAGVFARLFLARQRIPVLGLGFQHDERKALGVEQQKIHEARGGVVEVVAQAVEVGRLEGDARLQADVGRSATVGEEAPAGGFEQGVDLDARRGFVHGGRAA